MKKLSLSLALVTAAALPARAENAELRTALLNLSPSAVFMSKELTTADLYDLDVSTLADGDAIRLVSYSLEALRVSEPQHARSLERFTKRVSETSKRLFEAHVALNKRELNGPVSKDERVALAKDIAQSISGLGREYRSLMAELNRDFPWHLKDVFAAARKKSKNSDERKDLEDEEAELLRMYMETPKIDRGEALNRAYFMAQEWRALNQRKAELYKEHQKIAQNPVFTSLLVEGADGKLQASDDLPLMLREELEPVEKELRDNQKAQMQLLRRLLVTAYRAEDAKETQRIRERAEFWRTAVVAGVNIKILLQLVMAPAIAAWGEDRASLVLGAYTVVEALGTAYFRGRLMEVGQNYVTDHFAALYQRRMGSPVLEAFFREIPNFQRLINDVPGQRSTLQKILGINVWTTDIKNCELVLAARRALK